MRGLGGLGGLIVLPGGCTRIYVIYHFSEFRNNNSIRYFEMAESARATDDTLPIQVGDATGTNADAIDAFLNSSRALSASPLLIPHGDGYCTGNWHYSQGWTAEPATLMPAGFKLLVADSNIPDIGKLPSGGIARGKCNRPVPEGAALVNTSCW